MYTVVLRFCNFLWVSSTGNLKEKNEFTFLFIYPDISANTMTTFFNLSG